MRDGIHNAGVTVGEFLPKLGAFLLILIATWIVAKIVSRLVIRVARRLDVDQLVAKNDYGRRAAQKTPNGVAGLLGTMVKVAAWLVGLSLAFRALGPNPVTDFVSATVAYLPRVVAAVAIVVLALWLASVVRNLLRAALGGVSYGDTVATLTGAFIAVFGVLAALSQLNIAPQIVNAIAYAALFAVVGVVVVGVGGGLIKPMSERWQRTLEKVEQDAPTVKATAQAKAAQAKAARDKSEVYEPFQPYPEEPSAAPATAAATTAPAWQPAGRVSDDTEVYDQRAGTAGPTDSTAGTYGANFGVENPSSGTYGATPDPAASGAPRPAGYNPQGYGTPANPAAQTPPAAPKRGRWRR